jgi:hypothetical protein
MKTYLPWLAIAVAIACSSNEKRRHRDRSDDGGSGEAGNPGTAASGGSSGTSSTTGGNTSTGSGGASAGGSSGTSSSGASGAGEPTAGSNSNEGGGANDTGEGGDGTGGSSPPGDGGTNGGGTPTAGDGGTGGTPPMGGPPVVDLVLDGSSSMFENEGWAQAYDALVTSGTLAAFENQLELGFAIFQGDPLAQTTEDDPACATITETPFASEYSAGVTEVMDAVAATWMVDVKWETPTGHAIRRATTGLAAVDALEGTRKYILLLTDGEPNTCAVPDPQCGQDSVIKAVQDARAAGIRTVIVALGDLALGLSGCPSYARCGDEHVQDVANAGAGLPVEPPDDNYRYTGCHNTTNELAATYAAVGGGGTARFYSSANAGGLNAELTAALEAIVADRVP